MEPLQPAPGKLQAEREVGYRSSFSQRGGNNARGKFRGHSQVYQRKPYKDEPLTAQHPKPIKLESPPKDDARQLEVIYEDPSAVDDSAMVEGILPRSPPPEALVEA